MRPNTENMIKASKNRVAQPPVPIRAEELHRAARRILLKETEALT